jgi:translation initiation factor 1 (eIF-1/SUI1)
MVDKTMVVATVGNHKITVKNWIQEMDLYRVFVSSNIDPENPQDAQQILQSLIDQDIVLHAAHHAHFLDPVLQAQLQKQLPNIKLKLQQLKTRLKQNLASVIRLQKDYTRLYSHMILAQDFAQKHLNTIHITSKEVRSAYQQYLHAAKELKEKAYPFSKVARSLKARIAAHALLKKMQGSLQVTQNQAAIQKYLSTLPENASSETGSMGSPNMPSAH